MATQEYTFDDLTEQETVNDTDLVLISRSSGEYKTTVKKIVNKSISDLLDKSYEMAGGTYTILEALAAALTRETGGGGGRPVIYCWGDSLTEGVGGWIMPPDGHNAYMAYGWPAWVGQSFDVVNLGARSENVQAIMARQGADPITIQTAFTIPASKDTPVLVSELTQIYDSNNGTSLVNKSGELVKINKEVESPGLNPCTIAGVEGVLYRQLTADNIGNENTYGYYFRRLEDGEATQVPVGTEVQTFAMRFYRNGIAVIWMGANGGGGSALEYVRKVEAMVEYGEYDDYIVIISREYSGADVETIKNSFTDEQGICHVIYLMEQLPYRGYMMAGIGRDSLDTSSWETTDPVKKNAPLLCEYLNGQTGENQYGALHYSIWGYKAIGKLVVEKLGELGYMRGSSSGGGGSIDTQTDDYGHYVYKLSAPRTLNGTNYINTKVKLYDDVTKDWTLVVKWSGIPSSPEGWPANIFCCAKDGTWKGTLYRYYTSESANLLIGTAALAVGQTVEQNMKDNWGSTNVVIISKSGSDYNVFVNNTNKAYGSTLTYVMDPEDANDLPLIFGARYNAEGVEIQYKTAVTIEDARVYDSALDDAACIDLYNELIS